ncbi:MAG: MBOAT family O-acyltransferase [Erysipelotrichaceae bacterium]
MSFNSIYFLFTFLPCAFLLYYAIPARGKNLILVLISLVFYAWGEPKYIILLLALILFNYAIGFRIEHAQGLKRKRALIEALILNLFILIYFKYYGFILDSIFHIIPKFINYKTLLMPLGISFFTFQILSYLFDVYHKKCEVSKNIISFALYVSFFPKLIMGPIEPYHDFEKQIDHHPVNGALLDRGSKRFIIGLAQKVILANTFAFVITQMHATSETTIGAWLLTLTYTLQIYFDFCGYSNMAIGLANLFGFNLMENFNYPYISKSISEFWRRWHISLGAFFKNYVYIPLGGNRVSKNVHIANLMIVWLLTGLWHGASFNFIVWGLYYGIIIILEKYYFNAYLNKLPKPVQWFITFFIIMIGWVFFSTNNLAAAFHQLANMFHLSGNAWLNQEVIWLGKSYLVYFILGLIAMTPFMKNILTHKLKPRLKHYETIANVVYLCLFSLSLLYLMSDTFQSFLYFQF